MYELVHETVVSLLLGDMSDSEKKKTRTLRQVLLFHSAAALDINECSLDWLPSRKEMAGYVDFLADAIIN